MNKISRTLPMAYLVSTLTPFPRFDHMMQAAALRAAYKLSPEPEAEVLPNLQMAAIRPIAGGWSG